MFMELTSPKGWDLKCDGRYALHTSVEKSAGAGGEILITGMAWLVSDSDAHQLAVQHASCQPADRYILFELDVLTAFATLYGENGKPIRRRWKNT